MFRHSSLWKTRQDDLAVAAPPAGWSAMARGVALALVTVAALLVAWRLLPRLALFVEFNRTVLSYPWIIDYDEGINIASAYRLSRGHNPYGFDRNGFVSNPYPPVYLLLSAIPLSFGDLSLLGGRLIALASTLLTAVLGATLVARHTGSRLAGALAALLFLALTPTIVWAAFYKQDMPTLALGLAGLYWLDRWPAGRRAYGAIPWLALAVYTKQTAVTALLAAGLFVVWRDWRMGIRFGGICAATLALPFLALNWATAQGFHQHVVAYQAFPWHMERFLKNLRQLTQYHSGLLWLAGLGGMALAGRRSPTVLAWYAVTGLLSLLGNGVDGANFNHLLEALLVCCLLVGILVGRLASRPQRPPQTVALAAVLLVVSWQLPLLGTLDQWFDRRTLPTPARAERLARITAMVARARGEVLTDDNFILLRAGKSMQYQDLSTMGPLATLGRWDERQFVADLRARRFAMVVLNENPLHPAFASTSWTPAMLAAFRENYRLLYRDAMYTYVPRQ